MENQELPSIQKCMNKRNINSISPVERSSLNVRYPFSLASFQKSELLKKDLKGNGFDKVEDASNKKFQECIFSPLPRMLPDKISHLKKEITNYPPSFLEVLVSLSKFKIKNF